MAKEDKADKDAKGKKDAKRRGQAARRTRSPPPRKRKAAEAGRSRRRRRAERRSRADAARAPAGPSTSDTVVPALMKQFGYKTVMQVPRIEKITLNMGVGEAVADKKIMDNAVADMTKIAGQKPVVTKARKSIANFKIRDGYPVGCMVTLRGARMYEFLDRLVTIAMPRIRDFRGISGARLRRPRQLQHGRQGTDHFPRDRVRQDRRAAGHEHHHHHHREDRRRSQGAARRVQIPVQELRGLLMAKLAVINRDEKRRAT